MVCERVASLRLQVGERSLTVVLAYGPNSNAEYQTFLQSLGGVLDGAPTGDSVILLGDFNAHMGNDRTVPLDWQIGVVVPLFKKGDRRVCSNYRGITLLSLPGKVYARVLERRIWPIVDPRIQEEQWGFRPGCAILDQLYTLRRVLEGSWEFAQPVHIWFVDLEKAFDRVPQGILWEVLWEYGVRGPLLRAVRSLYDRSRSLVRIAGSSLLRKSRYEMFLTNLRNRRLSSADIQSMTTTIPSLYHNYVTGSSSFPVIAGQGVVTSRSLGSLPSAEQNENAPSSLLSERPAATMVPPARTAVRPILTPVLPDKANLEVLRADRRNSVRTMDLDGRTVVRVISPIFLSDDTMLENRWRVTDYNIHGCVLMSVLCRFKVPHGTKRKTSSPRPPPKCIRV
ncbi:uncharacterized protein LOC114443008 [Parambassis ranga]|uniref:Uncharacterized protein LOC114443008 n=1 Tax=Parambassis ranga TaxID=210632 RepID=A0A6P7J7T1_9TELE|nr:uncharacterized protein LOC114443008 [Parambassis ranga]